MHVELTRIRKAYGKLQAVAGIDLSLPAGSRVALIGPNGSGKTTLIRAILGLVAHEGTVRLDGTPDQIAYVPQIAPQMAATVAELVRTIADLRWISPRQIADLAAELGLDTAAVADRPFRGLSGGMKQKLLLAFALASRARLVILDEPTASLDVAARARFVALERELFADATVILSSHRLDELRAMVGRVVSLEEGRVVHDGPAAEYVRGHTESVIEVLTGCDGRWLHERGFVRSAGGWWTRTVDHAEKMRLVPEAIGALGAAIRDLVVRDHERLEVVS